MREREFSIEMRESPAFFPPAAETLTNLERAEKAWPKEVTENPEFRRQVADREKLNARLDAVMEKIPRADMSLDEALEQGLVDETQAADLHESLARLLDDGEYDRVALYLPFELMPSAGASRPPAAEEAAQNFRRAYMQAWGRLLSVQDVRANFVDGDVLEAEKRDGDLPRVVKAAHLIPKLVEKGFLSAENVVELIEKNDDPTLLASVADALPALADRKLIGGAELERLKQSPDASVKRRAEEASADPKRPEAAVMSPAAISAELALAIRQAESAQFPEATEKRRAWLRKDAKRQAAEKAGAELARLIAADRDVGETDKFLSGALSHEAQRAAVIGIRLAIEAASRRSAEEAKDLFAKYADGLEALMFSTEPENRDEAEKTFYHAFQLGAAEKDLLDRHGLAVPKLAGPFSENFLSSGSGLEDLKAAVSAVESDPDLSHLAYPLLLGYGSRLKGYGGRDADLDAAYILRPGLATAEAAQARELIAKRATGGRLHGDLTEFRVTADGGALRIDDSYGTRPNLGDSTWSHVLFGAAWEGDPQAVRDLQAQLLVPFFYDNPAEAEKRRLRLEELERDALQYRLMHRGYARFNPPSGGMETPRAAAVDGNSAFWDSGYRRTATKIYASRVFLPKLKK